MPEIHKTITSWILNPEYAVEGVVSVTLSLKCNKCGKQYMVKKFATPSSSSMLNPEPEKEIIGNIINTVGLDHKLNYKCNGEFSTKKIPKVDL